MAKADGSSKRFDDPIVLYRPFASTRPSVMGPTMSSLPS